MTRKQLQDRLVEFTVMINEISCNLQSTRIGMNISNQIARSSTSSALNYAEALGAESRKDFIHKIKIVLKELKETEVALRIIHCNHLYRSDEKLMKCLQENSELIAIFWKTMETAQKNSKPSPRSSNSK